MLVSRFFVTWIGQSSGNIKQRRSYLTSAPRSLLRRYTFTAKITPPMLKEKKGVLATRSPHRPNPIGVTLARVEKIDKKTRSVLLSACDLVHGTPVLDIKPYVPNYDAVEPCRVPAWIVETINTRNQVIISEEARSSVMDRSLHAKLKLYKNQPELFLTGRHVML